MSTLQPRKGITMTARLGPFAGRMFVGVCLTFLFTCVLCGCSGTIIQRPSAQAPQVNRIYIINEARGPLFRCEPNWKQCYITAGEASQAPAAADQDNAFCLDVTWNWVNALSVEEDGARVGLNEGPIPVTSSIAQQVGGDSRNGGRNTITVCFWPRTYPPKAGGETSTLRFIETSSDPQANPSSAVYELKLTYIARNGCFVQAFTGEPASLTAPANINLHWKVLNCKKIFIRRTLSLAPRAPSCPNAAMLGGGPVAPPPIYSEQAAEAIHTFEESYIDRADLCGTYIYDLYYSDVFGVPSAAFTWKIATVSTTAPTACPSVTPRPDGTPPACTYKDYCIACPSTYDRETAACVTSPNDVPHESGCTVAESLFTPFTFCMDGRTYTQYSCTKESARAIVNRNYSPTSLTDDACP